MSAIQHEKLVLGRRRRGGRRRGGRRRGGCRRGGCKRGGSCIRISGLCCWRSCSLRRGCEPSRCRRLRHFHNCSALGNGAVDRFASWGEFHSRCRRCFYLSLHWQPLPSIVIHQSKWRGKLVETMAPPSIFMSTGVSSLLKQLPASTSCESGLCKSGFGAGRSLKTSATLGSSYHYRSVGCADIFRNWELARPHT